MLHEIIHTLQTMTVRQYSLYEQAGKPVKMLYKRFKFVPVWIVQKHIEKFISDFNRAFNGQSDMSVYKDVDKLLAYNRIEILDMLAQALNVHLSYKSRLEVLRMQIGKKVKPDQALEFYVKKIAEITGIEIKTLEDVEVFKEEITRSKDKFDEMFNKPEKQEVKGVSIVELWWRICATVELSPDIDNTTLYELAELKAQAEEKVKAINELTKK